MLEDLLIIAHSTQFHMMYVCLQRELARMRVTQTLRGDLNSAQETELMNLLAEKVCSTS